MTIRASVDDTARDGVRGSTGLMNNRDTQIRII